MNPLIPSPPPGSRPSLNTVPPAQALLTIRIIWAALLLGQISFLAIAAYLVSQGQSAGAGPPQPLLLYVAFAMLLTVVPVMFFIRRGVHARARRPDGTLPAGPYSTGNIIFWAGCEGVAFFGIITGMLNQSLLPSLPIVVLALLFQFLTVPRKSALVPPSDPFRPT